MMKDNNFIRLMETIVKSLETITEGLKSYIAVSQSPDSGLKQPSVGDDSEYFLCNIPVLSQDRNFGQNSTHSPAGLVTHPQGNSKKTTPSSKLRNSDKSKKPDLGKGEAPSKKPKTVRHKTEKKAARRRGDNSKPAESDDSDDSETTSSSNSGRGARGRASVQEMDESEFTGSDSSADSESIKSDDNAKEAYRSNRGTRKTSGGSSVSEGDSTESSSSD
jgi:hypothetical protein